jgi:glycosyltransferase involved in cell wall biosynthesis
MHIWILNHYAITPDLPGGTRHYDFGKELVKRGYKVTIFASNFNHSLHKEIKEYKKSRFIIEDYEGVRFVWVKTFPYYDNDWRRVINMLSYSFRVYRIGKAIDIEKPDIIIGSSVHLFAVFTAYLLSKKYKTPFIMEVRDLWPQTLIDMGMSKWHPFVILLGILEKFLYKKADKIIVLLPKANEYIDNLGLPSEKIVWIPNGVNLNNYLFRDNSMRMKTCDTFKVIYTGGFSITNNLETLIAAAERTKALGLKVKYELYGNGMEKRNISNLIKEKGLEDIVFIKKAIPKKQVPKILQTADALFLPMRDLNLYKYGFSFNKLYDYLAAGKPIILLGCPTNNIVEEISAGVSGKNLEELVSKIKDLYFMPTEERVLMGLRGREYVEKYYRIDLLVNKLESIIGEMNNHGE